MSTYPLTAYQFVRESILFAQEKLRKPKNSHITGEELLAGIRTLAQTRFGLLARTVFEHWGITKTEDFGKIVFDLVEVGEVRKTDQDSLQSFSDAFDFRVAFEEEYQIDVCEAFR